MQAPSHTRTTPTRPQAPVQAPALRVKTHLKAGLTVPKLDGSSKDA
jgi:hypothetical protein